MEHVRVALGGTHNICLCPPPPDPDTSRCLMSRTTEKVFLVVLKFRKLVWFWSSVLVCDLYVFIYIYIRRMADEMLDGKSQEELVALMNRLKEKLKIQGMVGFFAGFDRVV